MNSKDPDKIRAHQKRKTVRCRYRVLNHYSGGAPICACCGESTLEFLSLDHIEGGGTQHRRDTKTGGGSFYRLLIRESFPSGFRVLCYNCNLAIGFLDIAHILRQIALGRCTKCYVIVRQVVPKWSRGSSIMEPPLQLS